MRQRNWGNNILAAVLFTGLLVTALAAQQPRNRATTTATAPVNNLKISYKTTTAGQTSESTTMIRGPRERSEMRMAYGIDMISITQCDLKRTIQLSDKTKKYVITPMETDSVASSTATPARPTAAAAPSTRGGVITYVIKSVDTGERKEIFGFQARHVKTTMSMESSPDACTQVNQKFETDGWYIDFNPQFTCDLGRQQMSQPPAAQGGCHDRIQFRQEGNGRRGYPLNETTTMYGPDGTVMFTSTKEVIDISRDPLDAALFDVPAGYTETKNAQELFGIPSMSDYTQPNRPTVSEETVSAPVNSGAKAAGAIRVGVVQINNKTDKQVSAESLRMRLIGELQGGNVEAVPLNAISPMEADAEARAKQCDYILYTDIGTLKTSKLGGMFGRVTGTTGLAKTEAKIEYRLFAVGEKTPKLQSTATAKEEGEDVSAGTAVSQEARAVKSAVQK